MQPAVAKVPGPADSSDRSSEAMAKKIEEVLKRKGIVQPAWPGFVREDNKLPGHQEQVQTYYSDFRKYQERVRKALIGANLIDDPNVPKKLSEAIDFKGTCEKMCPDWEKVDRIISARYDEAEKAILPDGSLDRFPSPEKMVKALARSAAGQEAPLPDEVRSAAALRRTVDYLFNTVLGNSDLPTVYTFLWDRTRAVRRDFVFHSFMSKDELIDQVYCLEQIVRFHVIAAHQMSKDGINVTGFSEQQELEQLGKALLSLIHAYEDCSAQNIVCENETEFRAYHILWGARSNPSILEEVQDWGWKFWGESEEIQLAVSLVEALQTPWDTLPLKPRAETDTAHNAFARFFSIVEDSKVSYTMACFAETFFNHVRFSILRTLRKSYRRPGNQAQTMDWTTSKLNEYLRFDDEDDVVPFCESHGLHFAEANGVEFLSFKDGNEVTQPSPPLKQGYSQNIVEGKRGHHSLPEAINHTLYEQPGTELSAGNEDDEEDSLFVKDSTPESSGRPPIQFEEDLPEKAPNGFDWPSSTQALSEGESTTPSESAPQPQSIFDRIPAPGGMNGVFGIPSPTSASLEPPSMRTQAPSPLFQQQPPGEAPPMFPKKLDKEAFPTSVQPTSNDAQHETTVSKSPSLFSFLQQTAAQPAIETQNQSVENANPIEAPKTSLPFDKPHQVPFGILPQLQPTNDNGSTLSREPASVSDQPFHGFIAPTPTANPAHNSDSKATYEPVEAGFTPRQEETPQQISPTPPPNRRSKLTAVAEWVALGSDGLMEQFMASQVAIILHEAARIYMEEEAARIAREADELARSEADSFRYGRLAIKFGRKWRENARLLWLKRRGRAARQARRELAESMRASKAAQSASLVEDFRASTKAPQSANVVGNFSASTKSRRRGSLESLLDATGVLDGVHDSHSEICSIAHVHDYEHSPKRLRSERSISSVTSNSRKHKRGQSEQQNPLRRSLLSDPTFLHGGSRILLMSDHDIKKESRSQISGVKTDYFRLKARGITTLSDGTPLAKSAAANNTLQKKQSVDGFVKPSTPRHSREPTFAQSVPAKPSRSFAASNEDIQVLKARAKIMMAEDHKSRQKRVYVDEDEELFARAKRVREQMDEGEIWYKKERERETASRSVS